MVLAGFGISPSDEGKEDIIPLLGVSKRHMWQTLGTEWGRCMVNDRVWLILAQRTLMVRGPGMIVSDLRFDNEAEWVRQAGGLVLHLERPGTAGGDAHASEQGVTRLPQDKVIINDDSLYTLCQRVKNAVSGVVEA